MRKFARIALMVGATTALSAGAAMAQPEAVLVTLGPEVVREAPKLGQNDVDQQVADLVRRIETTLTRRDVLNGATIELVLTDLRPNRPTMQQLADRPGLDPIRSLSIGGAAVEGTVTTADGTVEQVKFKYYTPTLQDAVGTTVWSDANRAFDRLANNLAAGRYTTR